MSSGVAGTILTRPAGNPASAHSSPTRNAVSGASIRRLENHGVPHRERRRRLDQRLRERQRRRRDQNDDTQRVVEVEGALVSVRAGAAARSARPASARARDATGTSGGRARGEPRAPSASANGFPARERSGSQASRLAREPSRRAARAVGRARRRERRAKASKRRSAASIACSNLRGIGACHPRERLPVDGLMSAIRGPAPVPGSPLTTGGGERAQSRTRTRRDSSQSPI